MTTKDTRFVLVASYLCLASMALGRNTPTVRWGHQLVTPTFDVARAAVVDSNDDIYFVVKKRSEKELNSTSKGVFFLKYNQQGDQLWSKQIDLEVKFVTGLSADNQGNIYVTGLAESTPQRKTKGEADACIAKYDQTGTQLWVRLLGTPKDDFCGSLAVDADGNLYVSGFTLGDFAKPNKGGQDAFIAAYRQDGSLLWQDQIGSATNDRGGTIRLGDDNDVYVCGDTSGSLARENNGLGDFFVARYERTGKRLWLHQFGTNASDRIWGMEIGELGHVYLGCRTNGNVGTRNPRRTDLDSCLVSISTEGELLWTRQFGPAGWDGTWDMARFADGSGDVLISGCQIPLRGKCQAYSRRYSPEGELVWTQEFRKKSARGGTCGRVVAIDSDNNCYQAGWTCADLFGVNNGTANMFIVRFDDAKDED